VHAAALVRDARLSLARVDTAVRVTLAEKEEADAEGVTP
jgi:hypothetical protein